MEPQPNLLTKRELQIVRMVNEQFNKKQIAKMLFISETTVKTHFHNIADKIGRPKRIVILKYQI